MLRILIFLAVVFFLGLGFSWVADNPGLVSISLPNQGIEAIEISLMVSVVAIVAIIAIIMLFWSIMMTIWNSPEILSRWRQGRRRDRGYFALSRGMIAAAAGDAANARKLTKESNRLLSDEPMVALLDAQTALLEENHDIAQTKFETMLENPETRLLGLRGLYVEAERQNQPEAASHYAERAVELAPDASWAGTALLRLQSTASDWQGALITLESSRWPNKMSKQEFNRLKAVLQTAQAAILENPKPEEARKLALSAHKLAPDLVPATLIAARISSRLGEYKKASKLLEVTWKLQAHPDIAETYVHVRSGDSAVDRLKRARLLAAKRENHIEGKFAIADAAIDAKDWHSARQALASILRNRPSERACLLMADIEEAEHGDRGRMRDWLSRAVRAPRDPAWTADGYVSENWAPISPISGKLDAFVWKVPVESLEGPGESIDYSDFATEPLPPEPVASASDSIADNSENVEATAPADNESWSGNQSENTAVPGDTVERTIKDTAASGVLQTDDSAANLKDTSDNQNSDNSGKDKADPFAAVEVPTDQSGSKTTGQKASLSNSETAPPVIPDDPGVNKEENPIARRFKLF